MKIMLRLWFLQAICGSMHVAASPQLNSADSYHSLLAQRALPVGTCNSNTPCENGACCGSNGLCGYSPKECAAGCTSNCNAKAPCGQYGITGHQTCPLNVCCSEFGLVSWRVLPDNPPSTYDLLASVGIPRTFVALVARVSSVDAALLLDLPAAAPKSVSEQLGQS